MSAIITLTIVILIIFSIILGMAFIAVWKASRDMENEMEHITFR